MKIITDNDKLKKYIPNYFTESEGESTFFEKLTPWLAAAEDWFIGEIVGDEIDGIIGEQGVLFDHLAFGVAAHALYLGVPSLDLVLTPNGFGVISTTNVAPASKERVERLRQSLLQNRDFQISLVLDMLLRRQTWRDSYHGEKFTASIFMHPSDVDPGCGYDKFIKFRTEATLVEADIASRAVSPELMSALRKVYRISATTEQSMLVERIKGVVRQTVKNKALDCSAMLPDLVQFIRSNPENFPQWQGTATAELYTPPVFKNEKQSTGYWF